MFRWLWVQIPAPYTGWTFFTLICCKIVMKFVWKDENKWKRGRGWPILKKLATLVGAVVMVFCCGNCRNSIKHENVNTLSWEAYLWYFFNTIHIQNLSFFLSLSHTHTIPVITLSLSLSLFQRMMVALVVAAFAWIHSVNMYMSLMGHPQTWKSIYYVCRALLQ